MSEPSRSKRRCLVMPWKPIVVGVDASPEAADAAMFAVAVAQDRKSTRLNSSHLVISYAVFCLKKKKITCCAQQGGVVDRTALYRLLAGNSAAASSNATSDMWYAVAVSNRRSRLSLHGRRSLTL